MSEKGRISWTAEKYQKLFAACLAAHPEFKVNYNKVAKYFGEGATYDAIETRFRPIKSQAKIIRAAVDSGYPLSELPSPQTSAKSRGVATIPRGKRRRSDVGDDEEIVDAKTVKKTAQNNKGQTVQRLPKAQKKSSQNIGGASQKRQNSPDVLNIIEDDDGDKTLDEEFDSDQNIHVSDKPAYPTPSKTPSSVSSKTTVPLPSSSSNKHLHSKNPPSLSATSTNLNKDVAQKSPLSAQQPRQTNLRDQTPEIIDLASDDEEANILLATTPSKKPRNQDSVVVKNEQDMIRRRMALLEAQDYDDTDYDP